MSAYLRLARFYFLLLGIFTLGRWLQGTFDVPYVQAHQIFSIVILTLLASVFYGAFCRRWLGYRAAQAMLLGGLLGLSAQIVIFVATLLSYALGLDTYFNHSVALNVTVLGEPSASVPVAKALATRAGGLIMGTFSTAIAGGLGWAMGALLPRPDPTKQA